MAATIKNLANDQLPAAKGTLYTCPGATTAVVLTISAVNTDGVARSINLYYKKSAGTSRRIIPMNQPLDAGAEFVTATGFKITMGSGDLIEGDASAAGVVDYVISGVERT